MVSETSVTGTPIARKRVKESGWPVRSRMPLAVTFAAAAIDGGVAAEAGAERERPPVGVVELLAGLELVDDGDHRGREGDVVDERRAGGGAPQDHHRLGCARAAGDVAEESGHLCTIALRLERRRP